MANCHDQLEEHLRKKRSRFFSIMEIVRINPVITVDNTSTNFWVISVRGFLENLFFWNEGTISNQLNQTNANIQANKNINKTTIIPYGRRL